MQTRSMQFDFEEDGTVLVSARNLILRLNRHLHRLMPARELVFSHHDRQYWLKIIGKRDQHQALLGPIYYKYLVALGDHINLWTPHERKLQPLTVVDGKTRHTAVRPLPVHLQFHVVTPLLDRARDLLYDPNVVTIEKHLQRLKASGFAGQDWTISKAPDGSNIITVPATTPVAPIIETPAQYTDRERDLNADPETGVQATAEEIEAMMGLEMPHADVMPEAAPIEDPLALRARLEN